MTRSTRHFILGVLALMVAASGAIFAFQQLAPRPKRPGGSFVMTEMTGKPVTDGDLRGKPTAIFFGFTSCPETCPVTLELLSSAMKEMGPRADQLNVVYVTVDPERDTPEQMRSYLSSFDQRIRGFTGSDDQLAGMARAYQVQYRRVPLGDSYTMDHSASVMLFDAKGQFVNFIPFGASEQTMKAQLVSLVR